jgi:hypothetical protein
LYQGAEKTTMTGIMGYAGAEARAALTSLSKGCRMPIDAGGAGAQEGSIIMTLGIAELLALAMILAPAALLVGALALIIRQRKADRIKKQALEPARSEIGRSPESDKPQTTEVPRDQ